MIRLSGKWVSFLVNQPETGMGYQIATLVLKDGRKFEQAVIIEGCLAGIRGYDLIPFKEEEIENIIVTHAKWDWNKK
jgi:hypothetical protein